MGRIVPADACSCGASPDPLRAGRIRELEAERDAALRERDEFEQAIMALEAKISSLAPHGSCACSYDRPGDVCMHHSPALAAAQAENARLLIALHDAIRQPMGVTPDSAVEFYSPRMADEAEARRPRWSDRARPAAPVSTATGGEV
ncbi:hypothetical protein VQ02_23490 [Methylobacterium variabile]|uniref:Uncharacterized protein n=1 Tax=Methylobacterium variabile TaxID=298794 RepID=A0A0J6V152_9HYPH|nr:hypothetical protein [Methylobacterium variabile]KMO32511.1 hypothetical protein VQ02_23490 [Methylobacterium variabile]